MLLPRQKYPDNNAIIFARIVLYCCINYISFFSINFYWFEKKKMIWFFFFWPRHWSIFFICIYLHFELSCYIYLMHKVVSILHSGQGSNKESWFLYDWHVWWLWVPWNMITSPLPAMGMNSSRAMNQRTFITDFSTFDIKIII